MRLHIPLPLALDANVECHQDKYDLVKRSGKLYDKYKHTFTFTENIKADVLWFFDYQDLPAAIQQYVTAKAARMCATKMVGDPQLNQLLQEQEAQFEQRWGRVSTRWLLHVWFPRWRELLHNLSTIPSSP